jgi:hypothetical protein
LVSREGYLPLEKVTLSAGALQQLILSWEMLKDVRRDYVTAQKRTKNKDVP